MNNLATFLMEKLEKLDFVLSFNMIGSAPQKERLHMNDEVDLYVLLDGSTLLKLQQIQQILLDAKILIGQTPFIETRRGPFKPQGVFQFHLIVDDLNSIRNTSSITLADWANTSWLLKGHPIDSYVNRSALASSFIREIRKTLMMLGTRNVLFKEWRRIGRQLHLIEKRLPITSLHDYCEFLKYAYKAMRNDFIALENTPVAAELIEPRILRHIESFKNGKLLRIDYEDFYSRVRGWNYELLRLVGRRNDLLTKRCT